MINIYIVFIRLIIGIPGIILVILGGILYWFLWAICEIFVGVSIFPFMVIFFGREQFRESWVANFPNFITNFRRDNSLYKKLINQIKIVWRWSTNPNIGIIE